MDLRWWAIGAAGLLCLAVGAAAAWLAPVERVARRLRPLAHIDRLTQLPEFARVQRIYVISMSITAGLLLIAFAGAVAAAARSDSPAPTTGLTPPTRATSCCAWASR
jgi:hypothetical protein